ncbi:MAG: hypothetical protein JWO44_1525 [Bacteroidetes bacterium]|nr:hypothetical protein [Bacteroidota bacterium]
MKNNCIKIVFLALMALGMQAAAQCGTCTVTITGTDGSAHVVPSGMTLCIAATATVTGDILVNGGTLCNQGTINSSNIAVTTNGTFNNYGSADIDSLLIIDTGSDFFNFGTLTGIRFATADGAMSTNTGSFTMNFMGDSIGTFVNNGTMLINNDFGNAYNSAFTNNGNFTVTNDFYNSYGATFSNNNYMKIVHDFYNSNTGVVLSKCMAIVQHDWFNSATISGPATTSCGGFSITGQSFNSGIIGTSSQHVDICDAAHPAGGMDGNIGTIAATTTYCTCANSCLSVGIAEQAAQSNVLITNVYPNPAVSSVSLVINSKGSEMLTVEVYDMMGKKQLTSSMKATAGENQLSFEISSLAQGTYILRITDEKQLQAKQMFNVIR